MTRLAVLSLVLLATACATPRDACIAEATEDLRVVESLIARDRATLDRGYALRREVRLRPTLQVCSGIGQVSGRIGVGTSTCIRPEPRERVVPVAVDLAAVEARLAGLEEKRAELTRRAAAGISQCRAAYPPG